jgi:hypothetical protein
MSWTLFLWSLVAVLGIATLYLWFIRKKEPTTQPPQSSK